MRYVAHVFSLLIFPFVPDYFFLMIASSWWLSPSDPSKSGYWQHVRSQVLSTPFLLSGPIVPSLFIHLDSYQFFRSDEFSTVVFVGQATHVLCKNVGAILFGPHEDNLDKSVFHEFTDKMVSDVHVLRSLASGDILRHEDGSNIVHSDYDQGLHWNSHWHHHLCHKLHFFSRFWQSDIFGFTWW